MNYFVFVRTGCYGTQKGREGEYGVGLVGKDRVGKCRLRVGLR